MRTRWAAGILAVALAAVVPAGSAQAEPGPPGLPGLALCQYIPTPENPPARPVTPPLPITSDQGTVRATIVTNHGDIVVELDRANAPCAVHNLAHLATQRYYDETQCWRLTNSARLGVLQCGDIYAAEKGGPGYRFADELTGEETYPRGTIAMGNLGPDTNGSQFFVVHSHANIDPAYTVLGKVTSGMEVLDRIVAGGIVPGAGGDEDGLPALPVHIGQIRVDG